MQKTELEATRELLKESTSAQKNQIELAALTALLNANLMRISNLESKKSSIISRANGSGEFIRDIILTEAAPVNASITELFEDCENLQKQIKLFLTK